MQNVSSYFYFTNLNLLIIRVGQNLFFIPCFQMNVNISYAVARATYSLKKKLWFETFFIAVLGSCGSPNCLNQKSMYSKN